MTQGVQVKRIYEKVSVKPDHSGYGVFLDGRQARTARGEALVAPTESLAYAVADEWAAQGEFVDRRSMPMTMMTSAAIDGGDEAPARWREDILKHLETDLLCYRADGPQKLVERQEAVWDPYLHWLREEFGAALVTTKGVAAVSQPDVAVASIRRALEDQSRFSLFGLSCAAAIAGSAVLALALWKQAIAPDEVFSASRLDEHFQEEQWGVDLEAETREEAIRREFLSVAAFLALLAEE